MQVASDSAVAPPRPTLGRAAVYWLWLGCVGFGGPAGQIALMHEDLVERRRWISEARFLHALNFCMVLPGPEAQQLATYIGWLLHRTWGGVVAGTLFVLPSLLILVGLSWVYLAWGHVPVTAGFYGGIKPAVTALVAHAAWRIGARTLARPLHWVIAIAAFVAIFAFDAPFPLIVVMAGLAGIIDERSTSPAIAAHAAASHRSPGVALIDDETAPPPHAIFAWRRFVRVLGVFIALWSSAIGALVAHFGVHATYPQMAWFFTKAALLTFGGAYAVLPYVAQGAVEHFHWLTMPQMIDGLALGETTPGPLIMVVAFVGFVGGWSQDVFGPGTALLSGTVAAVVVTFFTFLPSFCFVLLGGLFIESSRGNLRLAAPLRAITAAVVGVIVNLALFFAFHVLWPRGFGGPFAWWSAAIGIAAGVALFRYRVGAVPVILGAGIAGMIVWVG